MIQLYDLIQIRKGKETVVTTDSRSKINERIRTLRSSQRKGVKGNRITYAIRESMGKKFKRKPHK